MSKGLGLIVSNQKSWDGRYLCRTKNFESIEINLLVMSTSSPAINQNIEIVSILCRRPIAFSGLLSALQNLYPTTGWTANLLELRLKAGKRRGLFLPIGSNPAGPVEGWGLQPNANYLNFPQNQIYEPFCSQIRPIGCAPSCQVGDSPNFNF